MSRTARSVRVALLVDIAATRAQHAALLVSGDVDTPAWRLAMRPPRAEQALHSILLWATADAATLSDASSPSHGVAATLGRALSAPERAHLGDWEVSCGAAHTALTAAQAALAQLRLGGGSAYLAAAAAVLEELATLAATVADCAAAKVLAYGPRAQQALGWRSTMLHHAGRAGLQPPAAAA